MKKLLALFLAAMMVFAMAACSSEEPAAEDPAEEPADDAQQGDEGTEEPAETQEPTGAEDLKIGVILIGDENEGYSYAHIQGIETMQETLGLSDDQIIYKYGVPEDESCYDAAVDLAEQGCDIIFGNSFSFESYMMSAAEEYPEVEFCHATGTQAASSGLPNMHNYFTSIYQSRYVSGVVAGLKLQELLDSGAVTEPKVGYVGAYPYAEVVSGYTAFFLGVRSIVPDAYMEVSYTNSWFDKVAEGEAANALMANGCVIISQHADSEGAPAAVQAALEAGTTAYCVGYNISMLNVAPDAALTSATNNWAPYYTYAVQCMIDGTPIDVDWCGGYEEGAVAITELGTSAAEGTAEKVAEVEAALADGSLHVFDTSTWTVNGETMTTYTTASGLEGTEMISDGYFHESEIRSAPAFDIRIDGITELN